MKKIAYLLIAAMSLVSVASCVKELTPEPALVAGEEHVFTVSLPAATRTALVEGKTVWAKGDSLWIYNGVASESIVVPEEAWGKKEFSFTAKTVYLTDTTKTLYVVYPYTAAANVTDGKIRVKIPAQQNGEFAAANIAAAVSENYTIALKNVTSVLKVTVPADAEAPVYQLSISAANGNSLTGTCAVDFSSGTPALIPDNAGSNVSVQVDGFAGDFYVAVVPGTYDAGFKVTAATVDFEHASQTKESTVANTIKVNDLVDLGVIGDSLQPLEGDGTQASPWLIENLGHMIALATAVNNGETFEGQYLKVANDISGVNTPVGSFPDADNNHPFKGDFDGGNHTITLEINGADQPSAIRLGLFGALNAGAHIHDFTVSGSVVSTGDALGAIAGRIDAPGDGDPVIIENVINKATVKGPNYVGGIAGYVASTGENKFTAKNCVNEGTISASGMYGGGIIGSTFDSQRFIKVIENCINKGVVSANANAGGILGNGYFTTVKDCSNEGKVSAASPYNGIWTYSSGWKFIGNYNRGTGGIAGFLQNCTLNGCINSGSIGGVLHVGGVAGVTYWTNTHDCSNSGVVKSNTDAKYTVGNLASISMVGGVVGYCVHHSSLYDCDNTGDITGFGMVGGVAGYVQGASPSYNTANDRQFVKNCKNSGAIKGTAKGVGGVCGAVGAQQFWPTVYVEDCTNEGAVESTGDAVGGVIGMLYNVNTANDVHVYNCLNKADVEGLMWVGGVIGMGFARANVTSAQWVVGLRNCENQGRVLATRSGSANALIAGGIIGTSTTNNYSAGTLNVYNSLNSGDVVYSDVGHVSTYLGGLIGRLHAGTVVNNVNHGFVGPETGDDNKADGADALMGSLVGSLEGGSLTHAYYRSGSCSQAIGTASSKEIDPASDNVTSYSVEEFGFLEIPVTVKGTESYIVDDALNLWVAGNTSYKGWEWKDVLQRPAFISD